MTTTIEHPDGSGPPPADTHPADERRRRRWPWIFVGVVVAVAGGIGWYTWSQYRTLTSSKYQVVNYTVPSAQHLVGTSGETVYRIDPTHSSLTYTVEEKLFGHDANTARGTTNGIAGDLAINTTAPDKSRLGQIVVNVEQLHSDNSLRDARMRAANLESHKYPLAYLSVGDLSGLPATVADGHKYHFTMPSQLTVKGAPSAVNWDVQARMVNGELQATASSDLKMSTLGIGPISVAGLVSTGDKINLTMKLTALDPSKATVPTTIKPPPTAARSGNSPSFKSVVLPAMEANCVSCHMSGEVGAAHWKFDTARDAQQIADGIGTVVNAGYMPPWPASTKGVALAHSKRLDPKTIDALVKWARAGGPLDVPASTKVHPTRGPLPDPPRRDLVLKMPEAYAGTLSVSNDYRCFVLDPHITKTTYMTGYEVTPGVRTEIHHAQVFHQDAGQAARSLARSGQDGKPGWSCYSSPFGVSRQKGGIGFSGQPGLVAGWVPGQDPTSYPLHSGIRMEPGDVLVLQMHYHYDTTPIPDRTTVSLQLEPGSAGVKDLEVINPIGPVEIPCMPGDTAALCDRTAALADDARLYGTFGAGVEPGLLGLCGKSSEQLAATFKNGVASSSCDFSVPYSGTMVGVLGHMHTLGKSFRMTLDPDSAKKKVLLDIPTWNFGWQMNYQLEKPIHVTAGQKIRMECSWDRAADPNRPPKYIVFAEGTEDEMCFGTYGLIPDNQSGNALASAR
jgi:polyisoprenoid-binding protein YceI/mono/diheme cytochrome c family protein